MIRPLRNRHRAMILAIAVIAPAVFIAALLQRESIPAVDAFPAAVSEPIVTASARVVYERGDLWGELGIQTRVLAEGDVLALELAPGQALKKPDVLVYWRAGGSMAETYLLGALSGAESRRFALPAQARQGGELALYSLAHGQELAAAVLPREALEGGAP